MPRLKKTEEQREKVRAYERTSQHRKYRREWYRKNIKTRRKQMRAWYLRTRDFRRDYQTKYATIRRHLVYSLKNRPCTDCQGWFEPCQMEFDHLPGTKKKFVMGNTLTRSIKTILTEAKKCEVVCSNCHKLRTYRRAYANKTRVIGGTSDYFLSPNYSANLTGVS